MKLTNLKDLRVNKKRKKPSRIMYEGKFLRSETVSVDGETF